MVLHLSDLGPNCSEIRDLPAPSSDINQDKIGHISRKKHSRLRTEENDDQTIMELVRKKKVKKNNSGENGDDSSSSDHSCFVALVKASNLHKDALYLPQDLTSSVGLKRSCSEIVVTNERERSWALELMFNESSDTFYISRGWRSFCDDNGKKAGGIFVFKLVGNVETPILSFCSTDSTSDGTNGVQNNKDNCMTLERKKKRLRCKDSTLQCQNRFVTLTLPHDLSKRKRLYLPASFRREIGIHKPGMITMLGKDGRKSLVNLRWDSIGSMCFGRGFKDFSKENCLKNGDSIMLEAILENGTPTLSLFSTQSTDDRRHQGDCSKQSEEESLFPEPSNGKKSRIVKNNRDVSRDSFPPCLNRLVTLKITHDNFKTGRKCLPYSFARDNGFDKPGMITLVGKDGIKWDANLRQENTGIMNFGKGWKDFAIANGLKIGDSFTLEAILENRTPMLSLFSTDSTIDRKQQGECSKDSEKELIAAEFSSGKKTRKAKNNRDARRDSFPACLNRFVTLTVTHDNLKKGRKHLPLSFTRENCLDKPGMITLVGKDGKKWGAILLRENTGAMCLGKGWIDFAIANGLKSGESFTLEAILENGTPMLSLFSTESTSDKKQQGECSKANEKELISTEPSSGNKTKKVTNDREERRDSSSAIQSRFVTLTLTPEDVRACILILPSQFMKANGINKLGKITFLGKNKMKWFAYLLSKDGIVALGCDWKDFCEANGVKTGESFTLECTYEQDTSHTTYVFKFSSNAVE